MLAATFLALGAAVLHAGWNLAIKQSGERWLALWGQFAWAGSIGAIALAVLTLAGHGLPADAWPWAVASGIVHLPYTVFLAGAYDHGDFGVAYPVARGGGALLAAVGGVLLLDDHLTPAAAAGIGIAVAGLLVLATGQGRPQLSPAVAVAVTIGAYTLLDAQGARTADSPAYALATFTMITVTTTAWGLTRRGGRALTTTLRTRWRPTLLTGIASLLTYGMVLAAVRLAPVGYVTALRESSVVLAAFAGWRMLGEGDHRRRIAAAVIVTTGLVVLVLGA